MSSPGTLRFGQIAVTPSPPPSGYDLIYVKTDDVLYIQDSAGVEVALGSASSITGLTGEVTASGPGIVPATVSNSAVIGKVLTGFTPGPNSPVAATDTILQAFQKLQAQSTATSGSAITALTGDVSATGPGSVAATVNTVGGKTAAEIATSVSDTQAATALNTPSTIVKRDASGNFATSRIDATALGVNDTSGTSATYLKTSAVGTPTLTLKAIGSQTADIMQIIDSGGTPQMTFTSDGNFKFYTTATIPEARFDLRPSVSTLSSSSGANARYSMFVGDPLSPQAAGQGGGIAFGANQDNSGTATEMGFIWVTKNNSTSGNIDSSMHFATRNNASGKAQRVLDMDQNGNSTFSGNITQNGSTSGTFTQAVPATITSYTITWPNAQGAANSSLKNDGSGNLSWQDRSTFTTTTKTANYTITSTDSIIFVDTSGGSFTLTLPNPATLAGKIYRIIGISGTMQTNPLTLARFGSEKIEGLAANKLLQTAWGGWQVTTNGTDWFIF